MKKKVLYMVLILLSVFLVILYIFHNQWIESGLELAGEEIIGAKVEIDNLNVTFSPIGIEFTRLQIANPQDAWQNLIETDSVKFEMDAGQLLRGKYIIDEISLKNLSIGTKRATDGSVSKEVKDRAIFGGDKFTFSKLADDALKNLITTTPLFDIAKLKKGFNADSLLAILDIKSLKHADSIKSIVKGLESEWNNIKTDFESSKQKLALVEQQVKAIDVNNLKDIQNITNAITTVDNAVTTVNEISSLVKNRSVSVQDGVSSLTSSIADIDDVVKSDFAKLKDMARLPSFNSDGMAQMLVGTEMYKRTMGYLNWVDFARESVQDDTPETEKEKNPPRMKGQDIPFPTKGFPKFWIKKASLSANSEKYIDSSLFSASGSLLNLSDNQKLTGEPVTINLSGAYRNLRSLKLKAIMDRRNDIPEDNYEAQFNGVPIANFVLGKSDFLPAKISSALMNTKINVKVPGNKLDAKIELDLKDLVISLDREPKTVAEDIVYRVLKGINGLNIGMRVWNTSGEMKMALSTDLDEKISNEIQKILGEELTKLQNRLKAEFDAKVMPQINKFKNDAEAKINEITGGLGSYQSLITDKLGIVDNKKAELEAQLEKAKKGFLDDKLKGLFK
nr:TIGR03545 family protein [uncultured Sphaerochaeta sp.]